MLILNLPATRDPGPGTRDYGTHVAQQTPSYRQPLWIIIVVLVILWLGGFVMHFGGGLIHLLLVVAVIVLLFQLLTGRRAV